MKYEDVYRKLDSFELLKAAVEKDIKVAFFLGANQDRLQAIEEAMNKVAVEKGWL